MNRRTLLLVTFCAILPPILEAAQNGWIAAVVVAVLLAPVVGASVAMAAADRRHERRLRARAWVPIAEGSAAEGAVSVTDAEAGGEVSIAREGGEVSDP